MEQKKIMAKRTNYMIWCIITVFFLFTLTNTKGQTQERPNVLLIILDDLNDWVLPDNKKIPSPHIDNLRESGVWFRNAHVPSPACNPSRVAILTGQEPFNTGVYGNSSDWQKALPDVITLPHYFKMHGYITYGAGKIFHHAHSGIFHDQQAFDAYFHFYEDYFPYEKVNQLEGYTNEEGHFRYVSNSFDWGPLPYAEEAMLDVNSVNWSIDVLAQQHQQPFFLTVGLFRPHLPYFAPERYFEIFEHEPVEDLSLKDDLDDVPSGAMKLKNQWSHLYKTIDQGEALGSATRAYKAATAFADDQIGRLLNALEASNHKENTIVVLISDHGYHLGEKEHWTKFVLWERATRVPFIISGPGIPDGEVRDQPVSLINLYPTLSDLCDLPVPDGVDGQSLRKVINEESHHLPPAISTYLQNNHALRSRKYRYIRYADGTEELYDMIHDPQEYHNIADEEALREVIEGFRAYLPTGVASQVPNYKGWYMKNQSLKNKEDE